MHGVHTPSDQRGFWSAFFVLVITALAALGVATYTTVRTEGHNAANQASMLRAEYAATSGAYMGLILFDDSTFFQTKAMTVNEADVSVSVAELPNGWARLTSSALYSGTRKSIQVDVDPGRDLRQMAVYTTGNVNDVTPLDSMRNVNWWRMKANADSVPTIREDSLRALSTAQGHNKFGLFKVSVDYLTSFYHASGKPNVTWINGDFEVDGNKTAYGIFVVTGSVTLNGGCRVVGVIYLPNSTSTVVHGGGDPTESSIEGGIVSHGDITGKGNHITVQHNLTWMTHFSGFQKYPPNIRSKIVTWKSV